MQVARYAPDGMQESVQRCEERRCYPTGSPRGTLVEDQLFWGTQREDEHDAGFCVTVDGFARALIS